MKEALNEALIWFKCYQDGSMSRNNADALADEVVEGIKEALAQPPQRPWVGLTEEEMKDALVSVDAKTERLPPGMKAFAQAVEAKLKEKNT